MERRLKKGLLWLVGTVALIVLLGLLPPVRHAVLRSMGGLLIVSAPVEAADVGVITESGQAGELEMSDLYRERVVPHVLVLKPAPDSVTRELARRGAPRDGLVVTTLIQLGVPAGAITTIDAGEGGTTESALALSTWVRDHPSRALLVIDPTHARRYRRTLMRSWPAGVQPPRVTVPRANPFRAEDWWVSRRTRRDGVVQLASLAWDVSWHPW